MFSCAVVFYGINLFQTKVINVMKTTASHQSVFLAAMFVLLCQPVGSQEATVSTVDEGENPAMFIEPDGETHIFYNRGSTLCYARKNRNETQWQIRNLETVTEITDIAVTMTADRTLHVVCARYNDGWQIEKKGVLMYGKLSPSGSWSMKTIDVSRVEFGSLALDHTSDGELYLAWFRGGIHNPDRPVMLRKSSNQQWDGQESVLAYSKAYNRVDITVDTDNNLHLSTYNLSEGGILYFFRTGDDAGPAEKIEPAWSGGQMETLVTSVTVNSLNEPFVSYAGEVDDDGHENIKYAWKRDGKWYCEKVDDQSSIGTANKILITPSGAPGIGYYYNLTSPAQVRYSEKQGNTWNRKIVDNALGSYDEIETETDNNGYIHMAYETRFEVAEATVRYALLPPSVLITATPDILDFGVPDLNEARTVTLTLKNISDRVVTVENISAVDPRFSFSLTSFTLQSQAEQTVNVTFTQSTGTGLESTLQVFYNGTDGKILEIPCRVRRTGPALSVDPEAVFFENVPEEELAYRTVRLANMGNASLSISNIEVKRASSIPGMLVPTDFKLVQPHSCSVLAPDQSCELQISFQPGIVSSELYQYSYLYIYSNDPETPTRVIHVSGTMAAPSIYLPSTTLELGYAPAGQTKTAHLEMRNWGGSPLQVTGLALSGTDPDLFSCDENACNVIAAGGACSLPVSFTPDAAGDFTATLTITSNSYSYYTKSVKVYLSGTSLERKLELSATEIDFGQVPVDGSAEQIVRLTNSGSNEVTLTGLFISGVNPSEFSHDEDAVTSIAPGTSLDVTVTFNPLFEGAKSARLTIESNDSDEPALVVQLSGVAGTPEGNSLSGDLWNETSTQHVTKATVFLYAEGSIVESAIITLDGSFTYLFSDISEGNYTVLAVADAVAYPTLIPTYLGDKLTLSEATCTAVSGQVTGKDIHLAGTPPPPGGQGSIDGKMETGSGKGVSVADSPTAGKGDPVAAARVFLRGSADGKLKGYDITASDGTFEFSGLTNGSYIFLADWQGKPMDAANTPLTVSDAVRNIDIIATVGTETIKVQTVATGIRDEMIRSIRIYPVPAADQIVIEIPIDIIRNINTEMMVTDLAGKLVRMIKPLTADTCPLAIDISYLKEGIYLIKIRNESFSSVHKIIIAR